MIHASGDAIRRQKIEDDLKNWKHIIVFLDDALRLRKKEASIVCYTLATLATFMLWLYEPPFIAVLSFFGLLFVVLEQLEPFITELLFPNEDKHKSWTTSSAVRFREICTEICYHKANYHNLIHWLSAQKKERPAVYLVMVSSVLAVISYSSFRFSNLWLCYFCFIILSFSRILWYEWDKIKQIRDDILKENLMGEKGKKKDGKKRDGDDKKD